MKRRKFLAAAGGVAASALAAPAIAQTAPTLNWRMATSWPKSLDTLFGAAEYCAKRIAEITDNKFQIRVFAAGEIVPGLQVLDGVQNQTVEMGHTAGYYYWGKDPSLAFATAVPFGLNARQTESWLINGGGNELLNEVFADFNCYGIGMGNTCAQMGGWFRNELKTVQDLNGLKFRIGGFAGKVVERLGVIPQQLAAGDIYPALEKGTIDAVEWIGPYDDEKLGFHKIAKNYYYPGWWEGGANGHLLVNIEKWRSLPKPYQAAVLASTGEAGRWMTAKYDAVNPPAMKRLIGQGAKLRRFPMPILEASYKAANETFAEMGAQNPRFKRVHDSMMSFRDQTYAWLQVADMSFDEFQIRMLRKS